MNTNIEKIDNGYVVSINGKKTFCSTPESICGLLAEWALEECKRVDAGGNEAEDFAAFQARYAQTQLLKSQAHAQLTGAASPVSPSSSLGSLTAKL